MAFFSIWCWGNYYELFFNPDAYWSTRQVYGEGYINVSTSAFSYIYGADIGCSLFCEWYIWRTSWQSATEKHFKRAGIA